MLKLTFTNETANEGRWIGFEGPDAEAILDQWAKRWGIPEPAEFRERIVDWMGADIELPADDEAILDAILAADEGAEGIVSMGLHLEGKPE